MKKTIDKSVVKVVDGIWSKKSNQKKPAATSRKISDQKSVLKQKKVVQKRDDEKPVGKRDDEKPVGRQDDEKQSDSDSEDDTIVPAVVNDEKPVVTTATFLSDDEEDYDFYPVDSESDDDYIGL